MKKITKGLKYNYKTLVNFIAQPRMRCFFDL
jgi:hypothetical protein